MRTDFVWVDRQPAFITGGAPGLHMYTSCVATGVLMVRMQPWALFILIKNKGIASGPFSKKRTDFVWVDRQPAFTYMCM